MSENTGSFGAFDAAMGEGDPAPGPQVDPNPQGGAPEGGPVGGEGGQEGGAQGQGGGQSQPEPDAPQLGTSPVPRVPQQDRQDGGIPAWRLREEAEARRAAEARAAEAERRWQQHEEQQRRAQADKDLNAQNIWEAQDPNAVIDQRFDHRFQQGVQRYFGPLAQHAEAQQARTQQIVEYYSRRDAVREHGSERVQQAYSRLDNALRSNDPTAHALRTRILNPADISSQDPYGAIMDWDRRHSVYEATGGDLDKYKGSVLDEALKDPAFLARALEAHRQQAQPVQTGLPGRAPPAPNRLPPSLNRQTAAQGDLVEEEDGDAVFRASLRGQG